MDEVGDTPPEIVQQNMDTGIIKEKDISFEEVKERAWEMSQETLKQWKNRLDSNVQEKAETINRHLTDLSVLYGESIPEEVVVSLQYYPREGSQKGEPINNFVESGRLPEETADILYWVSNPSILPTYSAEDVEKLYEDASDRAVVSLLHEIQHRNFQKEDFRDLIKTSEQRPEVAQVLEKLQGVKGSHVEVTNELVTTYLETFGKERIEEEQEQVTDLDDKSPISIEVDKEKTGQVLEAVIREDVEEWRNRRKSPGPYTDLGQNWEKVLGGLPEGYGSENNESDVTQKDSDDSYKGTRIYEIARTLSTELAKRYVRERRKMDTDFMVELYKMVDQQFKNTAS
ncbi:hypothetical protein A2771_02480 [Candidatus Woesebacteria bacterium RIFCSPHIGHO2_01_FULL_38_26b]|uniref:Uncharacterized protein n=1 Tax=Candidatus Woesebacteria bacterium RIFCSPHIGHO2_01_FULL_38_26b TaxID=1802491 RepID=A0A1F7Y0F0_9BACT|nr:MAG: hypothetical protein A2771_02480 [Candidatus Woesebacteria bacterium RIFCSPHIGHO2_01_FULL_38_26b]